MAQMQQQPEVKLTSTKDYRDSYANSVQVRVHPACVSVVAAPQRGQRTCR